MEKNGNELEICVRKVVVNNILQGRNPAYQPGEARHFKGELENGREEPCHLCTKEENMGPGFAMYKNSYSAHEEYEKIQIKERDRKIEELIALNKLRGIQNE